MAFDAGEVKAKLTLEKSAWDKSVGAVKNSQKEIAEQAKKTGSAFAGMWKQVLAGISVERAASAAIHMVKTQIADTIRTGREFEREWANVTTMLSVSREESDKLRKDLRRLSPTLGDTADLARGMYQVLSASIEPAKAIKFLEAAARSAKAGMTETAVSVDALTTVINAYGLEAEDVTEISDIMFQTVKRGKLTYEEMAMALGTIVPVAATVGIDFREIAAAMATLTRQGIDSGTATMQLRQVLMSVLSPSKDAQKAAKELGIDWSVSSLKAKGLSGFLGELKDKAGGNSEVLARLVPNVRALTSTMALAGEAADGFRKDVQLMNEALGSTDEAFKKQMDSADFWMETFKNASKKVKESAYEGFVSPLRDTIRTSEDFDQKVTTNVNHVADATTVLTKAASNVFIFLEYMGKWKPIINLLASAKKKTDDLIPSITELDRQIKTFASDIVDFVTAQDSANVAIDNAAGLYGALKIKILETAEAKETLNEKLREAMALKLIPAPGEILPGVAFTDWGEPFEEGVSELGDTFNMLWDKDMAGWEEKQNAWLNGMTGAFEENTGIVREASESQINAICAVAAAAEQGISGIINMLKREAIAQVAKWIFIHVHPFPVALAATAVASMAISTLFNKITKMHSGGVMLEEGIVQAKPGELFLPIEKAPELIRETIREPIGLGGGSSLQKIIIQNRIQIGEEVFYKQSVKSIRRAGKEREITVPNDIHFD